MIIRFLLGGIPNQNASSRQNKNTSPSFNAQKNPKMKEKKKIFGKDEGEYVDYVEIKDK
jgi:hypothetical protein